MSKSWRSLLALGTIAAATSPAFASPPVQACALAESLSAGAHSDALVDLPFRTIDGRIYLDVLVNGRGPFVFAVDTGASGVGRADASLVAELALPHDGEGQTSDGVATAPVDTVRIATLTLGSLVRSDVAVIARDYRSRVSGEAAFSGILGREFFADGLLMIDFPARRLRFFGATELRQDQTGAMAYERAFRVPVTLGSMQTTGISIPAQTLRLSSLLRSMTNWMAGLCNRSAMSAWSTRGSSRSRRNMPGQYRSEQPA